MEQILVNYLSVVVCTYNRADLLPHCLTALAAQTLSPDQYEVIVVDNNSRDHTQSVVREFSQKHPNFQLVVEPTQGHSYARNTGWQSARGEYVAYLDDDTKATPDWCTKILHAFTKVSPQPAAVGGTIYPWYAVKPPAWFSDQLEIRTWGEQAGFLQPPAAERGFSGANMAFRREILACFGGFSTSFGIVNGKLRMGEDTELFVRVYAKEPLFWYDPTIKVYHFTPASVLRVPARLQRSFRGGKSEAYLFGRQIISVKYLRRWASLGIFLLKTPWQLWQGRGRLPLTGLRRLQEFAYRLGYLVGRLD